MNRKSPKLFSISTPVILIFVGATTLTSLPAYADISNFQKNLEYARALKDTPQKEMAKFKPQEVFKNQKGGYTEDPSQTSHYKGIEQNDTNEMEAAARVDVIKDEDYKDADGKPISTPGKTVTEGFKTRKIFEITQNDKYIKQGKLIETNAHNIVGGESNKHIDCKNKKLSTCKIVHVEKTCNEEVRTIQKICEKVPKITTHVNEIICPNCQSLVITQHVDSHCPSGHGQLLYADMVQTSGNHWDDIRFCTKGLPNNEGSECFTGGYIITSNRDNRDSGRATVPKKLHARIRISNAYFNDINGTIINETTGQTLYNNTHFNNGQAIELPYSDTQDQTFRFYPEQPQNHGGKRWFRGRSTGVMVLYIEHINREKVADITWPDTGPEAFCYEK